MSSSLSSLSSSLIARHVARASRPRPWMVPALAVKPATVPSSIFSSLPESAIARVTARVCRSQTLSSVSSFSSSKRQPVVDRQAPVYESVRPQTTLSARASARTSRDRPWLNQRSGSITAKLGKSKSSTAKWIKSQALDLHQALRRPSQASRQPSSSTRRHSPTSNTSMSIPAPPIVLPKRRAAATGSRQAVRYPSTSNDRPAPPIVLPKRRAAATVTPQPVRYSSKSNNRPAPSLSSRPQQVLPPATPDKSIAAIVREAFAFDINEYRAEVQAINKRIKANVKWIREHLRKKVTFDDKPKVIEVPRYIKMGVHVDPDPERILGMVLGWKQCAPGYSYEHHLVFGSDASNFDHSNCKNPTCNRNAKDLYMDNYEEWTAPTFTTISE